MRDAREPDYEEMSHDVFALTLEHHADFEEQRGGDETAALR